MPLQKTLVEGLSSSPSALIDLYSLDLTNIGTSTVYYFCNMSNNNCKPITFNSVQYVPFPILGENFGLDGKGAIQRPKLTVSNINGFTSHLLLENQQLNGAVITRTRVYARFLDAVNFPSPLPIWVTPDPTAAYASDTWVINRKVTENNQIVVFELCSPLELNNVKLPRRQIIANVCSWHYRHLTTCAWAGAPIADNANRTFTGFYGFGLVDMGTYDAGTTYNKGNYVTVYSSIPTLSTIPILYVCITDGTIGISPVGNTSNWVADSCPKTVAGCALRFTGGQALRTSAYPGVTRSPWIARA
jgi:lambda family phage minor tail protein L